MSQRRINIYGALIDTEDLPEMISHLMAPTRLFGNNFSAAASDLMQISAGSCLLPDGVLVVENEIKYIVIPNSSLPTEYTIIYQLEDTTTLGGSPAILRLISGLRKQSNFKDAVVLGWIKYPGGSIPLANSFFVQPSPLRIVADEAKFFFTATCPLANAIRSFPEGWTETAVNEANEIVSRIVNTSTAASTCSLRFPFVFPKGNQPSKIVSRLLVDSNCLVTYSLKFKGNTVILSPNHGEISSTNILITREFEIPSLTDINWTAGTTGYIEVSIQAEASRGVSLAYIGLTNEPTPFTLFI